MRQGRQTLDITKEEAEEILQKVEYWHYPVELPGGRTKPSRPGVDEKRHFLRKQHFFDPLIDIYGGSLRGKDVLDLGCCQGFWSFEAGKAGARSCTGIDSSGVFITEARAIAEVLAIRNCEFECRHLETDSWWQGLGAFHITFFLGLFYHLADPIFVFRKAASLTLETIVVDTETIAQDGSYLKIVTRDLQEFTTRKSNVTSKIRVVPTKDALCDLLSDQGFSIIHCLQPDANMPPEYLSGHRLSLIARRS
jgi:2-polyprenyl-3-methyl-5-hydroxy-6-metoxy-1,4-benzoquinol methylase